jgi:hypothetical protein
MSYQIAAYIKIYNDKKYKEIKQEFQKTKSKAKMAKNKTQRFRTQDLQRVGE